MESKYNASILVILAAALCLPAAAETDCETRPEFVKPGTCCPKPELMSNEIKEKCAKYLVPPQESIDAETGDKDEAHPHPGPHPHPHPPHHTCLMSCVFNETGILNSEQKLDEEKLNEYLTSSLQDANEVWIPILKVSFKTCIVKFEEMSAEWLAKREEKMNSSTDLKTHPGCPMKAGFLAHCVFKESFQNCPTSIWNDSDQCNAFRDYMRDCKPNHGKWHKHE